jgi:hypothetical protein
MKRGVAILMVLGVLASAPREAGGAEAWTRFVHPSLGFSLSYPAGWDARSEQGIVGVSLVGPEIPGASGLHINVNVVSETLPQEGNLDLIESIAERQVSLILSGYRRLRSDRTTLGGRPAILRYFTWRRNDGLEIYQMQLFTYAGRRAYVVTGTTLATSPTIEQDAGLLQRVVTTFRVGR